MRGHNEYNIPIPDALIDQIADRVAEKVLAKVHTHLVKPVPAPAPEPDRPPPTFLRLRDLVDRLGVSRSTIYKWIEGGRFPQSVSLGGRSVAWRRVNVEAWEANPEAYRNRG